MNLTQELIFFVIGEATELFLGAVFHDVNGTQFYNWLSEPGTKSELLINLTEAGMGNQSKECLSYLDEVKDIRCDLKMNVTICMRSKYRAEGGGVVVFCCGSD